MKIWLDDARPAPESWCRVRTPEEVIECLKTNLVTDLSLDHDLGLCDARTGYTVLQWIEEQVVTVGFKSPHIFIHTANSAARIRMELAVSQIKILSI